jgi:hypothetical protein
VSVVVGVRDGASELASSLDSVLAQREVPLELIVVDDGSGDDTWEQLTGLARREERLLCLRQERLGLPFALARGCAAARAPLIARHDIAGRSLTGRFARQLAAFARVDDLALASCFSDCVAPAGEPLYVQRGVARPDAAVEMVTAAGEVWPPGPTAHGSVMFRRDLYTLVGGYRGEFLLAQDWDLWLRLGEHGRYMTVGDVLYWRRLTAGSASFRHLAAQTAFGAVARQAAALRRSGESEEPALARARALGNDLRQVLGHPSRRADALANYHFGEVLRRGGHPRAASYLRQALHADPFLLRAWARLGQIVLSRPGRGGGTRSAGSRSPE